MRVQQFDQLTRLLARGLSRRELLIWLRNGVIAGLAAPAFGSVALATSFIPTEALLEHGLKLIPPYKKYVSPTKDVVKRTLGYLKAEIECLNRGYDSATCQNAALLCAINDGALKLHPYAGLTGIPDIFGAFKRNCGDGRCFQCCWTGRLCHTSFIGFPVINCNPNYGPETIAAGITLITDPNAKPGDACLFIPQTCDHIAVCVGGRHRKATQAAAFAAPVIPLASVEAYGETPVLPTSGLAANEWIASQKAIDNRARTFATQLQEELRTYLAAYTTELAADEGADGETLHELTQFLFGRGRSSWQSDVMSTEGWQDEPFLIKDATDQPVEPASRSNTAQILGLTRLLASVPNLAERLASVESRVWSDEEIDAYVAAVGDVDQEFLRRMNPIALGLLKRVMCLQYYGLLAVPLAGEAAPGQVFDGLILGSPPQLSATFKAVGTRGVELTLTMSDPEKTSATVWPLSVNWGDGQVTSHTLAASAENLVLTHQYDAGGAYLVVAMASNSTGLRSIAAVVVATSTNEISAAPARIPRITRVVLDVVTTFSGSPALHIDAMMVDAGGDPVLAGRSGPLTSSETSRSIFAAANPLQLDVRTLRLNTWYGNQSLGTPVLTIAPLAFDIFSTLTASFVRQQATIPLAQVRAYYTTPSGLVAIAAATQHGDGSISVPMRAIPPGGSFSPLAFIDIDLTPELFAGLTLPALSLAAGATWKAGDSVTWVEQRPDTFVALSNQSPDQRRVFLPILRR